MNYQDQVVVLTGASGGIVSDRIGRKKMLILAVVFYGAFTLPQAFANDLVFFAVFRLIAGLGVGSCIPIVTTMLSESVPSNRRGLFIGIFDNIPHQPVSEQDLYGTANAVNRSEIQRVVLFCNE